jgi:hypothetical protein
MGFLERDHAAGLEGDDVDMRVMAQVFGVGKAGGAPAVPVSGIQRTGTSRSLMTMGSGR